MCPQIPAARTRGTRPGRKEHSCKPAGAERSQVQILSPRLRRAGAWRTPPRRPRVHQRREIDGPLRFWESPQIRRIRSVILGLLGAALFAVALPAGADAYVYWANAGTNTIGRANLDGTGANQGFITGPSKPYGLAVDGAHLYWANYGGDEIGRANLDGTGANQGFITGASEPTGMAVDGAHVYWTNFESAEIGRADLSGTGVAQNFITGADEPDGVAVDGAHVYWVNDGTNTIGRANLNGSEANQSLISGANEPVGIAVDGAHIYWGNYGADTIGRANLNGTEANQSFITGASEPIGVAVDSGDGAAQAPAVNPLNPPPPPPPPPLPPSNTFSLGKARLLKKSGSATLTVTLPGPGKLVLKGQGLLKVSKTVKAKGKVELAVKPTRKTKLALKTTGEAKVSARITFTPTGGTSSTESKALTLKS
jgi:virginiamycin B lyase